MFGLRFHVGAYIIKCLDTETKDLFKNISKFLDIYLTTKKKLINMFEFSCLVWKVTMPGNTKQQKGKEDGQQFRLPLV